MSQLFFTENHAAETLLSKENYRSPQRTLWNIYPNVPSTDLR